MKRGFAACALPLVLAHNCPNNSIYLLWADPLETARRFFPNCTTSRCCSMARNAFAIRTSETSSPDDVLSRYFAPEVLNILPQDLFATGALVLRSAPGGGKTSILRIFTPGPLVQVIRNRHLSPHDEIYRSLTQLGVVEDDTALAFGILVPCSSGYAEIGPQLEERSSRALFRALVNARIILRTLRASHRELDDLNYPSGLKRDHLRLCADPV